LDTQTYSNLKKELEYYLYFTPGEIGPRAMKDSNSDWGLILDFALKVFRFGSHSKVYAALPNTLALKFYIDFIVKTSEIWQKLHDLPKVS
jgi:hypothetical protein